MAYQSGTATTPADLQSIIEAFAVANGWTNTAGVLSNSGCHARMTAATNQLKIEGADDAAFTTNVCSQAGKIRIPEATAGNWPLAYRLFASTAPVQIFCVVQYAVTKFQWLGFGNITKYGAWAGGAWFGASHGEHEEFTTEQFGLVANGDIGYVNNSVPTGALFWGDTNDNNWSGTYRAQRGSFLRCGVDGHTWPGASTTGDIFPKFAKYAHPLPQRQPNPWNGAGLLIPFWLFLPRASGYCACVGHVEHVRCLRIDNYNPGDIITLGSDQWMIFPWWQKDIVNRNGGTDSPRVYSTGTYGYALRYTP